MSYYITNGKESICYTDAEDGDEVNSYKWGLNTDCYKWIFDYYEAKEFVASLYNFAVEQNLEETRPEWTAGIIKRTEADCDEYDESISDDYDSPLITFY